MGKSAGMDNKPAELVQAGGEAIIDFLTSICNKIWKTGEWPTTWTQFLLITLPKKGNLQPCHKQERLLQKSRPVSEQEGAPQNKYSISGSSARNTCSISKISTMYSRRHLTGYGTKPYGPLWQKTSYESLKMNDQAQCADLFNDNTGDWFRTTVGFQQGCQLSPTPFLKTIMCEALDDHYGNVSIGANATISRPLAEVSLKRAWSPSYK